MKDLKIAVITTRPIHQNIASAVKGNVAFIPVSRLEDAVGHEFDGYMSLKDAGNIHNVYELIDAIKLRIR